MELFPKTITFLCVIIAMFTMLFLKGGAAEAASVQRFSSYRSNAGAPPFKILNAVAEVSARNIWTVGTSFTPSNPVERTLIEHWDGTAWSNVPSPNPTETGDAGLNGVAEISANDIWAVGSSNGALIEHWNGQQWSIVPSGSVGGSLSAVTEVS